MRKNEMKAAQKKIVSVLIICIVLVLGAAVVRKAGASNASENTEAAGEPKEETADGGAGEPGGEAAGDGAYEKAAADLVFWYEDESYTAFFEEAARRYYEKTGVKVAAECRETIDFMGDIYDKTMQDDGYPDVYLISGENLEAAYLYGLASVNETDGADSRMAANALLASSYRGKQYGYPLSYNTILFVYQNGYFGAVPESLQAIIDYSDQNEPAENVQYLLEWDVNDAFYDFPFISNSVTFQKSEQESMTVSYDEELYNQDLAFFEQILESFSVNAETVSEDSIVENFLAGRTLCAMLDSDSLHRLQGASYSLMGIPALNETLPAYSCASTDMLIVNDFSRQGEMAAGFAEFVTGEMASELYRMSGHFSVIQSEAPEWTEEVAYQAYESAVLLPNSQDAKDFWVHLEETISKYF